jgi:hypothetical protein
MEVVGVSTGLGATPPLTEILYWAVILLIVAIPAYIASRKGRSFALWFVFAFVLWPVALIAAIVIQPKPPAG